MSWLDKATQWLRDQIEALTCNTSLILGHPVLQSVSKKVFRKVLRKNRCARIVSGNLDEVAGRVPNPERTHPCPVPGIQIWATGWANKKYSVICEVRFLLCIYLIQLVNFISVWIRTRISSWLSTRRLRRRVGVAPAEVVTTGELQEGPNTAQGEKKLLNWFTSFFSYLLRKETRKETLCVGILTKSLHTTTNHCTHTSGLSCGPFSGNLRVADLSEFWGFLAFSLEFW